MKQSNKNTWRIIIRNEHSELQFAFCSTVSLVLAASQLQNSFCWLNSWKLTCCCCVSEINQTLFLGSGYFAFCTDILASWTFAFLHFVLISPNAWLWDNYAWHRTIEHLYRWKRLFSLRAKVTQRARCSTNFTSCISHTQKTICESICEQQQLRLHFRLLSCMVCLLLVRKMFYLLTSNCSLSWSFHNEIYMAIWWTICIQICNNLPERHLLNWYKSISFHRRIFLRTFVLQTASIFMSFELFYFVFSKTVLRSAVQPRHTVINLVNLIPNKHKLFSFNCPNGDKKYIIQLLYTAPVWNRLQNAINHDINTLLS